MIKKYNIALLLSITAATTHSACLENCSHDRSNTNVHHHHEHYFSTPIAPSIAPIVSQSQEQKDYALYRAVLNGDLKAVQTHMRNGADINKPTVTGTTALMLAIEGGHVDIVQKLINQNAHVQLLNTKTPGLIIWEKALKNGDPRIIKIIQAALAPFTITQPRPPITRSAEYWRPQLTLKPQSRL